MCKGNCWFVYAWKKAKVKLLVCINGVKGKTKVLVWEERGQSLLVLLVYICEKFTKETAGLFMLGKSKLKVLVCIYAEKAKTKMLVREERLLHILV